jgi:signal transduction histidine kinase
MDDFFQSIKYRDFSRWFVESKGSQDIRTLHAGFNLVNKTITTINSERQAQFIYLQKILEMVDVGIIAYNVENGNVMWCNDSLLETIDLPKFKNISFVESRKPQIHAELFDTFHSQTATVNLTVGQENLQALITDTVFNLSDESFKLIVVQNIDKPLNQNESESWRKLLSVMTHEIMNSIAPISSLAETLENRVEEHLDGVAVEQDDLEDFNLGISSIRKRSEGLMQFAKTYRSLNKVTDINRSRVAIGDLISSIEPLFQKELIDKSIEFAAEIPRQNIFLEIDQYLIEQVLINLIKNAIEAVEAVDRAVIKLSVLRSLKGNYNLIVKDNGPGIADDVKENIFVPFYSTKNRGSGVGLSLCKQIMTLHGGKIQVEDAPEGGALFRLVFY